jgi:hypothetical protein
MELQQEGGKIPKDSYTWKKQVDAQCYRAANVRHALLEVYGKKCIKLSKRSFT